MPRLKPDAMPTVRQYTVLRTLQTALGTGHRSAREMYVRSDVLWRMEEAGWVARSYTALKRPDDQWYIKLAGNAAVERYRTRPIRPERWKT
jgi:hypothetical protein